MKAWTAKAAANRRFGFAPGLRLTPTARRRAKAWRSQAALERRLASESEMPSPQLPEGYGRFVPTSELRPGDVIQVNRHGSLLTVRRDPVRFPS
jgi:hypothetical protein